MRTGCTTVLVEHFARLMAEASPELRLPVLESILARGTTLSSLAGSADGIRAALFGLEPGQALPLGALTRISDRKPLSAGEGAVPRREYCVRIDPVTLRADLGRVIMISCGLAGFGREEQQELENCVRTALREQGLELSADHPERWTIVLPSPLPFSFVPLQDALGMNMADVMPSAQAARDWRRVHNEIQVALHACSVNTQRRLAGQREVNAVWIWGEGYLPDAPVLPNFDLVCADNPVSRGLARLAGCVVTDAEPADVLSSAEPGTSVLVDWGPKAIAADAELQQLERLLQGLIPGPAHERGSERGNECGPKRPGAGQVLRWYGGTAIAREYTRFSAWRFWRRPQALASYRTARLP